MYKQDHSMLEEHKEFWVIAAIKDSWIIAAIIGVIGAIGIIGAIWLYFRCNKDNTSATKPTTQDVSLQEIKDRLLLLLDRKSVV